MNQRTCLIVAAAIIVLVFVSGCGSSENNVDCVQASASGLTLKWNPPTTNEDGSPLTDLEGYNIYYGALADSLIESVTAGTGTSYTITLSTPGRWYFAVTAYNVSQKESGYSNIVCVDAI